MAENFISGLIAKAPPERAPDYVKALLSIKREELIAWLQEQTGDWINAEVKVSRNGKWFAAVNAYKKGERQEAKQFPPLTDQFVDGSLPF